MNSNQQTTPTPPSGRKSASQRLRGRVAYSLDPLFNSNTALIRLLQGDIAVARRISRNPPARAREHLLVAPKGWGNIGDQAMLESYLENTTFPVTVLVENVNAHKIPSGVRGRVTQVEMPDLFVARPWVRRRVRREVAALIARHATMAVVGADVMDGGVLDGGTSGGGYARAESTIRLSMMCMCNELGTPNRVLGFSWNAGAIPKAVYRALSVSQPRSLLCVRDPHSLERLDAMGDYNLRQVADMVFSMNESETYEPIQAWLNAQAGRRVILVNASGVLARKGIHAEEYAHVVRHLLRRGCSVVILPHTIRSGDNDLEACVALSSELGEHPHLYLVADLLHPHQVVWLARQAFAVFTGRMHLSIIALNQGVPAIILSTQGKVSGLVELFGVPELLVEPATELRTGAITALDQVIDNPAIRDRVETHLPNVRALAALNFLDIERPQQGGSTIQSGPT